MGMTRDELIDLIILQKDYHEAKKAPVVASYDGQVSTNEKKISSFINRYHALMSKYGMNIETIEDGFAPPMVDRFPGQPSIPYVLFKPVDASKYNRRPLIIHTHGGPHVYFDKTVPHAEIAYFVSHGYVVVCPNYRGSTGYPNTKINPPEWQEWVTKSKDKHHIIGAEDVYAVACHVRAMGFVESKQVYFRGGSFGSFVNSHLLAMIHKGLIPQIFAGGHLSGGLKYPIPAELPTDIPLLITHGQHDAIVPIADARLFMEKMLLAQLLREQVHDEPNYVQTFIAQFGNHHLIDPKLTIFDRSSLAYQELRDYLALATGFFNKLSRTGQFQPMKAEQQLRLLMPGDKVDTQVTDDVLIKRAKAYAYVTSLPSSLPVSSAETSEDDNSRDESNNEGDTLCPTMANLKLVLGSKYTGVVRTDFKRFLQDHFAPVEWLSKDKKEVHTTAGVDMLRDEAFIDQMVAIIEQEQAFLASHPDHMVMYHAGEQSSLQLYSFIKLWKAALQGKFPNEITAIDEMRCYDFMTSSYEDIKIFLDKMQKRRTKNNVFNHTSGFADRAIACVPTLISNYHNTASCSLWWYYAAYKSTQPTPILGVVTEMLTALGIYTPERVKRYIDLFSREIGTMLHEVKLQSLLQQFFIPYKVADQTAYVCQIWGETFKENSLDLSTPSTLKDFFRDPIKFESKLRDNSSAFTNHGNCPVFGGAQFTYASALQLRYLFHARKEVHINSYFRQPKKFREFVSVLSHLIREDFADFLAHDTVVPNVVISGAGETKTKMRKTLRFHSSAEVSDEVLFDLQLQLFEGLVQNARKEIYHDLFASLPRKQKTRIQSKLGERLHIVKGHEYLYQLCRYLSGYTYYDLFEEAAREALLNSSVGRVSLATRERLQEDYDFVMDVAVRFSSPESVDTEQMSGDTYYRLTRVLSTIEGYFPKRHHFKQLRFFQQSDATHLEGTLFSQDLSNAIESVRRYAYYAKQKGYGYEVSGRTAEM